MEKVKLGPETLLYPMPAVLVGAMVGDKPNFMTVAWCGIAASTPPAISVAIRRARYTLEGINASGIFSVNVPSADLAQKVDYCGLYTGHKRDKSQIFQVEYGRLQTAPLIKECPVNLECKVIHSFDLSSHMLIIGQIMETHSISAGLDYPGVGPEHSHLLDIGRAEVTADSRYGRISGDEQFVLFESDGELIPGAAAGTNVYRVNLASLSLELVGAGAFGPDPAGDGDRRARDLHVDLRHSRV